MEEVLRTVGDFGKFQYKITLLIGLISALTSACIYATVFIVADSKIVCTNLNSSKDIESEEACRLWPKFNNLKAATPRQAFNFTCHFDTYYYDKTIITELNLVCERKYLAGLTQTSHILGATFGFCGGIFGDKYGRRKSTLFFSLLLTTCLILTQVLMDITSLSVDARYAIFATSQFLVGLLVNCVYCTAYVLLMEFTTEEHKTKIANLNSFMYVLGELAVGLVYYYSRDWNVLCWCIAFYSLVLLIFSCHFMYESPAWLMESKRAAEALVILKKMAKCNGKKDFLDKCKLNDAILKVEVVQLDTVNQKTGDDNKEVVVKTRASLLKSIFTPSSNLIKTVLLLFIWIFLILLYYGISLGVTEVDGVDPYLMYFLSTLAELVGYICCYINDIIGRKRTLSVFFIITALVYALMAYLSVGTTSYSSNKTIILLVLALIGKCAISGAYNLIYIYTSELYSSSTRNTVLLLLVCFGGTSSMVAPQINMLKSLMWNPLPYLIYSVFSFLTCICIWFLPDVTN